MTEPLPDETMKLGRQITIRTKKGNYTQFTSRDPSVREADPVIDDTFPFLSWTSIVVEI